MNTKQPEAPAVVLSTALLGPLPDAAGYRTRYRSEWEHLMAYGYAPGHYMNTCHVCKQTVLDVDKRAITCRPCAEAKHGAREFTPAELVLMNEAGLAKPGICGA